MKISIIVLFFTLLSFQTVRGQSTSSALFLEGGGVAPYYSLNYSKAIFDSGNWAGYLRIGAGIWDNTLSVPLGLTLVAGKGDHHPELTFGINPFSEGLQFWDRDQSDLMLDLVLGLAYRYQPVDGTFFFSIGGFPYLRLDPTEDMLSEKQAQLGIRPGLSIGKLF